MKGKFRAQEELLPVEKYKGQEDRNNIDNYLNLTIKNSLAQANNDNNFSTDKIPLLPTLLSMEALNNS